MAKYFLHLRDWIGETLDTEGVDYADIEGVRKALLLGARDVMAGDIRDGIIDLRCRIDAENERGELVCSLPFERAIEIISKAA